MPNAQSSFDIGAFGFDIWALSFGIYVKAIVLQHLAWRADYAFKNIILKTI